MTSLPRCLPSLGPFVRSREGGVGILFGLALLPLCLGIGAAVDYSRATHLRTRLQSATDAAVLAVSKRVATADKKTLEEIASSVIAHQTGDPSARLVKLKVLDEKTRVEISATASSANALMRIAGFPSLAVSADAETTIDNSTYEIALVLDNSGSMAASAGGASKIQSLRDAANKLLDTMLTGPIASRVKISIVPFTLSVQVGAQYAGEKWIDRKGQSPVHWQNFDRAASTWKPVSRLDVFAQLNVPWGGCVESRPGTWGVSDDDATPSDPASLFVPMLAPDEPGAAGAVDYTSGTTTSRYYNSYLADGSAECGAPPAVPESVQTAQNKLCKYRNYPVLDQSYGRGPNFMCDARPIVRLTSDLTALRSSINAMAAAGNTNLFEGFAWGWRTLSHHGPFADGEPYTKKKNKKVVILMTDGMNVWGNLSNHNGSVYSPFGYYTNGRLGTPPANPAEARAQIDAKTLAACTNAKAQIPGTKDEKVTVYTVGFSVASDPIDATGLDLLKKCASPGKAFVANDSKQFMAVFEEIARQLGTVRLTQ